MMFHPIGSYLAVLYFIGGLIGQPSDACAAEFNPAQRAAITEILRDAMRNDPTILRDAIEAIRTEESHRQEADARTALAAVRDRLVDPADPVLGNPRGDVTVVEFFDIRCGYCRKLQPAIVELLRKDPKIRLALKDLPILGPASVLGAQALLASQAQEGQVQGGYAKLRDVLMSQARPPTRDSLRADAQRLGLDVDRLLRDMDSPAVQARIDTNLALAARLNIQGTPALVIGDTIIPGAVEVTELQAAVRRARGGRQ